MPESSERCGVCGFLETSGTVMARVVIEGRALSLCRSHAATVVAAMPETFEEMRSLFVGLRSVADAQSRWSPEMERRSPLARRASEDRRVFPPRPEGRRLGAGRRATDPRD